MKLDIGTIWNEASDMVASSKEVMAAIAGVFFLLPSFAFSLLLPAPQMADGAAPEAAFGMLMEWYKSALPWLGLMVVIQAVGQLAIFAMLARPGKVTVGEALRDGLGGLLPLIAAQLIVSLALAVLVAIAFAIGAASGSVGVMVLIGLLVAAAALYVSIRMLLSVPVIAIDRVRNPIAALQRSWDLTRGRFGAILLYMFLLVICFIVAALVTGMVVGVIATLLGGPRAAEIVGGAVSALLSAVFTLYVVASLAAIHRRLSGGSSSAQAETFS